MHIPSDWMTDSIEVIHIPDDWENEFKLFLSSKLCSIILCVLLLPWLGSQMVVTTQAGKSENSQIIIIMTGF
jgi:hypothetical protein